MKRQLLTLPLLLGAASFCPAQGLAALQERAALVVEARLFREGERILAEVRRTWKGPSGASRLELFLPTGISAHIRPAPGGWHLLHLVPLARGSRLWAPLQAPLAVIALDAPEGPALAGLVGRLASHRQDPPALAADLLEALFGSWPVLVDAAAQDLLARPDLLRLAPPEAPARILALLRELPPSSAAARSLVHLAGTLAPTGWASVLVEQAAAPGREELAPSIGSVLAFHLGEEAVHLLARRAGDPPNPGLLLALGATRLPAALPLLGKELARTRGGSVIGPALSLHRTRQAAELLAAALAACPAGEEEKARLLVEALAEMPISHSRRLLAEVARGGLAPAHAERAALAIARRAPGRGQ